MSTRSIVAGLALMASATAIPSVATAQSIAVAAGNTNCRAGPGTSYHVLTTVYGGAQVQIIGRQGGWHQVAVSGLTCWMAGSRLQFAHIQAPVYVAPEPYYDPYYSPPPYASYPYFYGGPSISFSFGDFDRDRHHWRRGRGDRDWDSSGGKKRLWWRKGHGDGHRDRD
jgi:uncharacterized protein YraI